MENDDYWIIHCAVKTYFLLIKTQLNTSVDNYVDFHLRKTISAMKSSKKYELKAFGFLEDEVLLGQYYRCFFELISLSWQFYTEENKSINLEFNSVFELVSNYEISQLLAQLFQNVINPEYFHKKINATYSYLSLHKQEPKSLRDEDNLAKYQRQIFKDSIYAQYEFNGLLGQSQSFIDELIYFASRSKDDSLKSAYSHCELAWHNLKESCQKQLTRKNRQQF